MSRAIESESADQDTRVRFQEPSTMCRQVSQGSVGELSLFLEEMLIFIVDNGLGFFVLQVNASDVVIVEGILIFHDVRVREYMNMKIFVDTG